MAFHVRRVNIKVLNDSKEIALIVYVNSIILTLLVVVEFALSEYHVVYSALFGLALLLEATVFLALIFIPKVEFAQKLLNRLTTFLDTRWCIFSRILKEKLP